MKAIVVEPPGKAHHSLRLDDLPDPVPGDEEVLVKVHASALNRADILQRMGNYPTAPGASAVLGLELAGEVAAVGARVTRFQTGDRVYGLCGGGGYGELATIHESLTMLIPEALSMQQAAAIPEVFFTANTALRTLAELQPGERALIHAGGSGVGIAAIQIARLIGAEPWITAGTPEKCAGAMELGAEVAINYRDEAFADVVKQRTGGEGVNVILDVVGRDYWQPNLDSLAYEGRIVLVGLMGCGRARWRPARRSRGTTSSTWSRRSWRGR